VVGERGRGREEEEAEGWEGVWLKDKRKGNNSTKKKKRK